MKILLLTPGTGNFHCGSCLHDEALCKALKELGHDAQITALYLPLVLDHKDDAQDIDGDDVHMGGINLYLQAKAALFRHAPAFAQRILDRPGLLRKASQRADLTSPTELGRMTEQMLLGGHGKTRLEVDKLVAYLNEHGRPDVVLLNNALLLGLAEPIRAALRCAVACTLQGEDTFLDGLPDPWRSRCWELLRKTAKHADHFLPVSAYHGGLMAERMGLDADKVSVVYNGINAERYPVKSGPPDPPVIGYLARLCEAKGLHTLVDAYLLMHERGTSGDTRLHLYGAATPTDQRFAQQQFDRLTHAGLGNQVSLKMNVSFDEKIAALRGMSVLSVPAAYGESFGLYVLEANAVGVPAVVPDHAGLAEVIGMTGGGILCQPNDAVSLAETLAALIRDAPRREALGEAGREAVRERFTATHMARSVADTLEPLCQPTSA